MRVEPETPGASSLTLILFRHGPAGSRDPARWPDDRLRPLTEPGRAAVRAAARALAERGLAPEVIFASPWRRAHQTAELVAEASGLPGVVPLEALATMPDLHTLATSLAPLLSRRVALVGHAPFLDQLLAELTGDDAYLARELPKAGWVTLELPRLARGAARVTGMSGG